MSAAGGSAAREAAAIRAHARRGVWRRVLAALGVTTHTRRADAQARAWDAGAHGEAATQTLLSALERTGWTVLHDRAIPGAHSANADHVLVSPGARVFVVDSKQWTSQHPVHEEGGSLWHGTWNRDKAIRNALFEAGLVARVLGVPVQALIAVHNAPVDGDGLIVGDVPVVPAARLVELLRANDGPRQAGAAWLGNLAAQRLPEYPGGG